VNLLDRAKAMRGYTVLTLMAIVGAITGVVVGVEEGVFPLVLAPVVPAYMGLKLWRRGRSLRQNGLRLRRVLLMPRAKNVIPPPPAAPGEQQLLKLAPREILESPYGPAIRRAAEDRAAIRETAAKLSKQDRAQLRELEPTVDALVERMVSVAQAAHRLEHSLDPRLGDSIDARIAAVENEPKSVEGERRLALLRHQRASVDEIIERRAMLARQLENIGLTLGNLRLDLIKLRSSGLQSTLSEVSTATQEARALSRDIGLVLEAAAELEKL
jgi:serine/threonine-protein kinase